MKKSLNFFNYLSLIALAAFMIVFLTSCGASSGDEGERFDETEFDNIPESDFPTILTGSSFDDYGERIAVDSKNNVLVTGLTFGFFEEEDYSGGIAYLLKYSPKGEKLWLKEFTKGYGRDICIDKSDDSIYVVFSSSSAFGGHEHLGSGASPDVLLFKFDTAGNEIWSNSIATTNDDSGAAIEVDGLGNIYLVGHTRGDLGGTGVLGDYDFYIRKFSKDGNILKTIQFGTDNTDIATGIDFDSNNNVYITGRTLGNFAAAPAGMYDIALAKFDPDLNEVWKYQKGTAKNDKANGLAVDSNDNIYLTGTTYADLGEGGSPLGYDVFLAKYDSNGNEIFIKQTDTLDNGSDEALDIAIDSNNKIYVAGVTTDAFEGNVSAGEQDAFMIRYDNNGNTELIVQFGTTMNDEVRGLAIDGFDDILMTGESFSNFDTLINEGGSDIFILKYDNP